MALDPALLMAYLDGELDETERDRVEAALAGDEALRTELEAQRRLRARLASHYESVHEEAIPPRFQAVLGANVVDFAAARERRRPPLWAMAAALAASLVLGLVIGGNLPGRDGDADVRDGVLVARGELARALDTQLASAQPAEAETRIGVTFARADGGYCRTFRRAEMAGLACREGDDWQLLVTARAGGEARGDYRQAGAQSPLVLQAAQEMMSGEPLDAEAEARARDALWRR